MTNFIDIYGILFDCPAGDRLRDCPNRKVEKLSFKGKLRWFDNLNYEEKSNLHKHHIECSNKRGKEVQKMNYIRKF
jgi:hypothetical protein